MQITSDPAQVRTLLDRFDAQARDLGLDPATCDIAQITLGEVLNNVVEHAYRFETGHPIGLEVWLHLSGLLCKIQDEGHPMPNGVPPAGVLPHIDPSNRGDLPEGGFGWAMVYELTQDLQYTRTKGQNVLSFVIPIPRP